jgi:hypothetical protein
VTVNDPEPVCENVAVLALVIDGARPTATFVDLNPFPSPDIVTIVDAVTVNVVIANVAVVAPAETVTLAGADAMVGLLLDELTISPPVGAAAVSVTVPVALALT